MPNDPAQLTPEREDAAAVEAARGAQGRRDWPDAIRLWSVVRDRFPDDPAGYIEATRCLAAAGRTSDMEAMYGLTSERFPHLDQPAIEFAWQAHHRRDWPAALARWERVRLLFPQHMSGFLGGAFTLVAAGRTGEADDLLRNGMTIRPDDPEMAIAYARQAQASGDMAACLERWDVVRSRWRRNINGYIGSAQCLFDLGRMRESDGILEHAMVEFSDQQSLAIEYARLAQRRRDWGEAARRWILVKDRFPNHLDAWVEAAQAMLEAGRVNDVDALLNDARAAASGHFPIARLWANFPARRHEWPEVNQRWNEVRDAFPREIECYVDAANALEAIGRQDEAEALLATARQEFPGNLGLLVSLGHHATRRKAWSDALTTWEEIRQTFPNDQRGYVGAARALSELLRPHEGAALLEQAVVRFPDSVDVWFTWAQLAPGSMNSEEVLRCWQAFRTKFPGHPAGYTFGAWYFQELGRPDDADALLTDAMGRVKNNVDVARAWAHAALRRGDTVTAAQRFRQVVDQFPSDRDAIRQLISTLMILGHTDQAAAVLTRARGLWPHDRELIRTSFEIAQAAGDLTAAFDIWTSTVDNPDIDVGMKLDLAWYLYGFSLPPDRAAQLLAYLGQEADTGQADWLPRVAGFTHLAARDPALVRTARAFVLSRPAGAFSPGALAVLQRDLGIAPTPDEIMGFFDTYVAGGRLAMTAHLFSAHHWARDPEKYETIKNLFQTYMQRKWQDSSWCQSGNETEILSLLIFAAVFCHAAFDQITRHARNILPVGSENDWTSAAGIVQGIVRGNAGLHDVATPMIIPRHRLRIACCVSGQLRGYQAARESWSRLGLDQHDTSYFVHTWKDIGRNWHRMWAFLSDKPKLHHSLIGPDATALLQLRYPGLLRSLLQTDASEDDLKNVYQTEFVRIEDDKSDIFVGRPNVWKMHYKIREAHRFALEDGREFDLMIRIRPDLELTATVPIDWHEIESSARRHRLVYTDLRFRYVQDKLELGDQFCVTAPSLMNTYANVLSDHEACKMTGKTPFWVPDALVNHVQLGMFTTYRGILSEPFPITSDSRLLDARMPSVQNILALLHQDMATRSRDAFDQELIEACEQWIAR